MNSAGPVVLLRKRPKGRLEKMGTYRIYRLDGVGRIRGAGWLDALNDRFALEGARMLASSDGYVGDCEVWQRDRLIARVHGAAASG